MKLICLLIMVPYLVLGSESVESLSQRLLKDKTSRLNANDLVPSHMRNDVISYVRKVRDREIYGNGTSAEILLVVLEDEEHIDKIILDMASDDAFVAMHASSPLGASGQLSVIPKLVDYLYLDEPAGLSREFTNPKDKEFIVPPLSADATGRIRNILRRSPQVSEETKQWAENLYKPGKGFDTEAYRQKIRDWWPENKKHFETKEYDKIRPLGAGTSLVKPVANPETKIVPPAKEEPALLESFVPVIAEKETGNSFPPEKPSRPWRVTLLAVGILVVACMGIFGFRKARNRS